MRFPGHLAFLALVAALLGAPSSVSAALVEVTDGGSPLPVTGSAAADEGAAADELVADVLLFGVAGVASVAIVGVLLLIAGGRREPERVRNPIAGPAPPTVAEDATMRRIARAGRGQPFDDPIVVALGIEDEMAARRALRQALRQAPEEDRHPARRPGVR